MAAHLGNNYWQFAGKHGRDYKYQPKELWEEFCRYAQWLEDNPLLERKGFAFQGVVTKEDFPKLRAMTLTGFYLFADIDAQTFANYSKNKEFFGITTRIRNAIYTQKFEGAAAELLNPNIIARDLGLIDKQDVKQDVSIVTLTPEQREAKITALKQKLNAD